MNVLLTCAGRRNYLVRFFQEALQGQGKVLACDAAPNAPAFADADEHFVVPPMDHPEYLAALITLCEEQSVRLLVSVNDLELEGLAQAAACFRAVGTIPVVSAPEIINLCHDKWAVFQWLREANIDAPNTYRTLGHAAAALTTGEISFPVLIKPRWGTTSIGIERVENNHELTLAYEWVLIQVTRGLLGKMRRTEPKRSVLIQEWLDGPEYGLDVVNDLSGQYACTLARRKLAMRAGNTDRAVTVEQDRLKLLGETIGYRLGHIGSLDCDAIATDDRVCVLDLNPRLGGGYPFSHLAGANLPAALLAWARGEEPDPAWLASQPDVLVCKFDDLVVMSRPAPAPRKETTPNYVVV